ncbi:MAG: hypothetical protein RLZZ597_3409, partial [Cyanobacteriota bacterium]
PYSLTLIPDFDAVSEVHHATPVDD